MNSSPLLSLSQGASPQGERAGSLPPSDFPEFETDLSPTGPSVDVLTEPDPVQVQSRGVTSHHRYASPKAKAQNLQGSLWESGLVFKHSVAAKLRESGHRGLADELDDCHSQKLVLRCQGCRSTVQVYNRCDRFFCPCCTPRLARERRDSIEWWTKTIQQPKHVVLTVRNVPDLTKGHVKQLKKWFSRLVRRKFCRNWVGGFYSLEVTNEGRGWHLHIHALIEARYIDARELSLLWNEVTNGMGRIVKVKDCRDKSYLQEVTKYAVKGSMLAEWTGEQIATFIAAFSGVRSFGVFGSLYGKRTEWKAYIQSVKEKRSRCSCGCNEFRCFSEAEWEMVTAQLIPESRKSLPPPSSKLQLDLFIDRFNSLRSVS